MGVGEQLHRSQLADDKVSTSDASPTVAASYTIPTNSTVFVTAEAVAKRSNGTGRFGGRRMAVAHREGAAGAARQGAVDTPFTRRGGGAGNWDVTIDVSGNDVRVVVTGDVGHDIDWAVRTEITVAPNG